MLRPGTQIAIFCPYCVFPLSNQPNSTWSRMIIWIIYSKHGRLLDACVGISAGATTGHEDIDHSPMPESAHEKSHPNTA